MKVAMMSPTAIKRSMRVARLKKAHHTMISRLHKNAPSTPDSGVSGVKVGRTNLINNMKIAATTPGHSRRACCTVDSSVLLFGIVSSL